MTPKGLMLSKPSPAGSPIKYKIIGSLIICGIVAFLIYDFLNTPSMQAAISQATKPPRQTTITVNIPSPPSQQLPDPDFVSRGDLPDFTLTAPQLFKAYEANEVAADRKYKDKIVLITGYATEIGKDFSQDPYIYLSSGEEFDIFKVQAGFTASNESDLEKINKGDKVRLKCRVGGKSIYVQLKRCYVDEIWSRKTGRPASQ